MSFESINRALLNVRPYLPHGRQESTILSVHITILHQGMIIVSLPYTFAGQMRIDEITRSSPYGASTIAGGNKESMLFKLPQN